MSGLRQDMAAYDRMRDDLERDFFGQWALVYGSELVGTFDDFQEVAAVAVDRFGRGPYLIRRIGLSKLSKIAARPLFFSGSQ